MPLPNIKELFLPDPGYIICDIDLYRADLQVVIAEADDKELREACQAGVDMHQLNADTIGCTRAQAKAGVHATNYGAKPPTLARALGVSVKQAELFQTRWFKAHPGIEEWHDRTREQLQLTRQVRNKFGFRRFYFDRLEGIFPEALAWVPQSTVANVINKGLLNVYHNLPHVQILMQVHDSLVVQIPADRFVETLPELKRSLEISIPYEQELIIGVGLKASRRSWGHCKELPWDFNSILVA